MIAPILITTFGHTAPLPRKNKKLNLKSTGQKHSFVHACL